MSIRSLVPVIAAAAMAVQGNEAAGDGDSNALVLDDTPRPGRSELPDWFAASFLDLREDLIEAVDVRRKDGLAAVTFG